MSNETKLLCPDCMKPLVKATIRNFYEDTEECKNQTDWFVAWICECQPQKETVEEAEEMESGAH